MSFPVRLFSEAAERNRQPMLDVLRRVLPASGGRRALEIASGTGQHVVWFARHLPEWRWQPTDFEASSLASIAAWCQDDAGDGPLANALPPRRLDVCERPWSVEGSFDAIVCANMLHIAPWACCPALMQGAARHLTPQGVLVTYGPYFADDAPVARSNLAFDAELRLRNPQWGVRRLTEVVDEAEHAGLQLRDRFEMPANNLMLVFAHGAEPKP